jgi:hypothetical protein
VADFPGDDAADRWDELLALAEKDLTAEINKFYGDVMSANVDALSASDFNFTSESLKALAEGTDQAKIDFMTQNLYQVQQMIAGKLKDTYNGAVSGAYANAIAETDKDFNGAGSFTPADLEIFKKTRTNDSVWFNVESDQAAKMVHDALIRYAITGSALSLKTFELPEIMDSTKLSRYGSTIIRTSVSSFYRQAHFLRGANAGVKRYKYGGPAPLRPFCSQHYGKTYKVTDIVQMNNGQTRQGSVMLTMGGCNCRHRWIPVIGNSEAEEEVADDPNAVNPTSGTADSQAPKLNKAPSSLNDLLKMHGLDTKETVDAKDMENLVNGLNKGHGIKASEIISGFKGYPNDGGLFSQKTVTDIVQSYIDKMPENVLKNMPKLSLITTRNKDVGGHYDSSTNELAINPMHNRNENDLKRTIYHELSHWNHIEREDGHAYAEQIRQHYEERTRNDKIKKSKVYKDSLVKEDDWYNEYAGLTQQVTINNYVYKGVEVSSVYSEIIARPPEEIADFWNNPKHRETLKVVLEGY